MSIYSIKYCRERHYSFTDNGKKEKWLGCSKTISPEVITSVTSVFTIEHQCEVLQWLLSSKVMSHSQSDYSVSIKIMFTGHKGNAPKLPGISSSREDRMTLIGVIKTRSWSFMFNLQWSVGVTEEVLKMLIQMNLWKKNEDSFIRDVMLNWVNGWLQNHDWVYWLLHNLCIQNDFKYCLQVSELKIFFSCI